MTLKLHVIMSTEAIHHEVLLKTKQPIYALSTIRNDLVMFLVT